MQSKVTRDEKNWEIELRGEIPAENIATHRAHVLNDLKKNATLDGFRQGKAPEDAVVRAIGEPEILRRTIEHAVQHELPEMLAKENANIVATPRVTVEKAPKQFPADSSIVFVARAPLAPEVKLPDYAAIAKKHNAAKEPVTVTDEEHSQTMTHLKRERARITKVELGIGPKEAHEEAQKMEEKDLPALDDEFVKTLGYESLEKFSDAVRSNIQTEKELNEKEKQRAVLLDELVEQTKISYPSILREYELDEMESRLKHDLESMHATFERYLTEMKKTRDDLRLDWHDAADKRARVRLVLTHIALAEKLNPDVERFARELEAAKKQNPSVDPDALRAHIEHALRNEAVLAWLESR